MSRATLVLDAHAPLAEGPLWHRDERALYWTSLLRGELHRFDPDSGTDEVVHRGRTLGCFAFTAGGGFILGTDEGLFTWRRGEAPVPLQAFAAGDPTMRLNDGKVDPKGRMWVGSNAWEFTPGAGALRRLDTDGALHVVLDGLTLPNGLDWAGGGTRMYFTDSFSERVWLFDVDEGGTLHARRDVAVIANDTSSAHGLVAPDGLCTDAEGNAWVAVYGAGEVRCVSPAGQLLEVVSVPVLAATSCTFGGDDLQTLYITTGPAAPGAEASEPHAGGIFACRPGVAGLAATPYGLVAPPSAPAADSTA
ncbi:MAG: SMP-30/gluconolactonase/LRE family protein [Candidatus Dormibacteria bacterium]